MDGAGAVHVAEMEVAISTLRATAEMVEAARRVVERCRDLTGSLPRAAEVAGSPPLGSAVSGFLDELVGSLGVIVRSAGELEERLASAAATYETTEALVADESR